MNYLITYENSVFVAKQDPRVIMQQIQMISDRNKVGQMFWFYNTIIAQIGQYPQYENERNLLNWAKAQRAYAYLAMATTMIGGAANVAHIISETSAQRDIEQYGQQLLIF